jgi:SAM-dependent methyltransferase
MNYHEVEERIKAGYREVTVQYRLDDEIEVQTKNHERLSKLLKEMCWSFSHPIAVLDIGCGTGRYFHCLENVATLTGIDISDEMLASAATPVRQDKISVKDIRLMRENIYLAEFPSPSFDFILSLGMFGHGCPVTVELCNKLYQWLKPGGKLFFNLVDFAGLPLWYRARRQVRKMIYPALTKRLKHFLDKREQRSPFFSLTKLQLENILAQTCLTDYSVSSHSCQSPLWNGRHLECLATKPPAEENSSPTDFGRPAVSSSTSSSMLRETHC